MQLFRTFSEIPLEEQGFIQALLQISVFQERLSFMVAGQNQTCAKTLALVVGASRGCCKLPLWGSGAKSLEALTTLAVPGFQIGFPYIILWSNLLLFRFLFVCVKLAWWLRLPDTTHKMATQNGKSCEHITNFF